MKQFCFIHELDAFFLQSFLHDPIVTSVFLTTSASPLWSLFIFALLEVEEILRSWRHKKLEEYAQPIGSKFPGLIFHLVMSSSASKLCRELLVHLLAPHSSLSHKVMRLYSFFLNLNPLGSPSHPTSPTTPHFSLFTPKDTLAPFSMYSYQHYCPWAPQ